MLRFSLNKIIITLLLIFSVLSMNPWPTWYAPIKYLVLAICLILIIYKWHFFFTVKVNTKLYLLFLLFIILTLYVYIVKGYGVITGSLVSLLNIIPVFIFLFLDKDYYIDLLNGFITFFYYITLVGIIFYFIINVLNLPLPYITSNYLYDTYGTSFKNYFFLIQGKSSMRFNSIFTEPGHYGMICSLLLFCYGYDFKDKKVIVIILGCILSFSLASYVLIVLGILLRKLNNTKYFIGTLLLLFSFSFLSYVVMMKYYESHKSAIVSELILSRIVFTKGKGISGNNRNSYAFEKEFKKLKKSSVMIMGVGTKQFQEKYKNSGTSYKTFLLTYGYIGIFFILCFFCGLWVNYISRIGLFCIFIFSCSFMQRPYITWTIETILCILCIIYNGVYKGEKKWKRNLVF